MHVDIPMFVRRLIRSARFRVLVEMDANMGIDVKATIAMFLGDTDYLSKHEILKRPVRSVENKNESFQPPIAP